MLVEKWRTWLLESNWYGKRCNIEMRKIMHCCFTQSLFDIGISSKWLEEKVLNHWKNAQRAGKYIREAESIYRYLGANEITRARIKRETSLCHRVNPRWKHSLNIMGNSDIASWTFLSMHFRSSSFEIPTVSLSSVVSFHGKLYMLKMDVNSEANWKKNFI